jgi:hypothetical protein
VAKPATASLTSETPSFLPEDTTLKSTEEYTSQTRPWLKKAMLTVLAAVVIVIASWAWFPTHPFTAKAQYDLGNAYENGDGVPQDATEAVSWYRKAADQGDPDAQTSLGYMYHIGKGVQKDATEAVSWYRKAADQGNVLAQCNLGTMYENGDGVQKDDTEAVSWFRKAAEQGYAEGEFNLGANYASGDGVPKDDAQALSWYQKAADQGYEIAKAVVANIQRANVTPPVPQFIGLLNDKDVERRCGEPEETSQEGMIVFEYYPMSPEGMKRWGEEEIGLAFNANESFRLYRIILLRAKISESDLPVALPCIGNTP